MKTFVAVLFFATLFALSPNVGGKLLNHFEQEMAQSNFPTSRQQVERKAEDAIFGDFDSLMSSIG